MFQVVWFKRDLRIEDHAPLAAAALRQPVLPLYIAEPDYWAGEDTSARQWEFIAECLTGLDSDLRSLGQPLILRIGNAVDILTRLHRQKGIAHLWSHEETGNLWTYARDRAVSAFCREAGIPWTELPQSGVVRRLKDRNTWSKAHADFMARPLATQPARLSPIEEIDPGHIPSAAELGLRADPCPGRQRGGRAEALERLDSFFAGRGRGYTFGMSSPLSAEESCSRLSPYLASGAISIREVLQRAWKERQALSQMPSEARAIPIRSVDSLIARLHWHCHFMQKLESEPEIERRSMHPAIEARRIATLSNDDLLLAWGEGRTGFPFVDACMRSLAATGWINFRMRALLMAFASYHLALDWQASGAILARLFTDYEPGIHWPQVQMQSGQTGINTPRIYNPVKQSEDQDPKGIFIRRWLPELALVPTAYIHEPWRMDEQQRATLCLDYPPRIVDHIEAAKVARQRLSEWRATPGFGKVSQAVFSKHGSRKRQLGNDDPAKSRAIAARRAAKATRQMSFDI
jgi:deoxyribodipyrimidine photo-lyase